MALGTFEEPLIGARRKMVESSLDGAEVKPPRPPVRPEDVEQFCCPFHDRGGPKRTGCSIGIHRPKQDKKTEENPLGLSRGQIETL